MRAHPVRRPAAKKKRIVGSIFSFIVQRPSIAGGATACAVAIGLISANALWYQPSTHPAPMFSTRDHIGAGAVSQPSRKHAGLKRKQRVKPGYDTELIGEIQTALANRGYYNSPVDGLFGSQTRLAIERFQKSENLSINGKASVKLLTRILLAAEANPQTASIKSIIADPDNHDDKNTANELISDIQSGLRNYGYQGVIVDGLMGSQTMRAIRRFQLDYGMEITGEPSPNVLQKLKEIGAVGRG